MNLSEYQLEDIRKLLREYAEVTQDIGKKNNVGDRAIAHERERHALLTLIDRIDAIILPTRSKELLAQWRRTFPKASDKVQ